MTIEEKAKRYDEVFGIARNVWRFSSNNAEIMRMEELFPELRESEGERIRKELIGFLRNIPNSNYTCEEMALWLEKQGDQKPADKVEPKFHEGDWVVFNNHHDLVFQVEKIENYEYTLRHFLGVSITLPFNHKDIIRAWIIQDAKDGDVLYSPCNKLLWIFKTKDTVHCGCNLNYNNGAFCGEGYIMMPTDAIPATKSQRDTLFAKMKESGYEWDDEKKELKKIEQKPAWSEDDEKMLNGIIDEIEANKSNAPSYDIPVYEGFLNWLKSIKQRIEE